MRFPTWLPIAAEDAGLDLADADLVLLGDDTDRLVSDGPTTGRVRSAVGEAGLRALGEDPETGQPFLVLRAFTTTEES